MQFCFLFFLQLTGQFFNNFCVGTLVWGMPDKCKRLLFCPPPVKPISVWAASPGPFTTHPIIDILMGFFMWANFFSNSFNCFYNWKSLARA